jgi:hypothetical protein
LEIGLCSGVHSPLAKIISIKLKAAYLNADFGGDEITDIMAKDNLEIGNNGRTLGEMGYKRRLHHRRYSKPKYRKMR